MTDKNNAAARAFEFAAGQHWAILKENLSQILDIARRAHTPDFEAVAQRQADRGTKDGIRRDYGSVAVINIIGPIFRYANLFTAVSGATSVDQIAANFRAALDDPAVSKIILNIDSPGGAVAGMSELSHAIYAARAIKPIIAYADDLMASGAYWIGSAASKVVASPTALLGSIGVLATITREADAEGETTYEFVSSTSPKKAVDLETDAGKAQVQTIVDDIAAVFVADVARNRGVAAKTVLDTFGQGDVLIAAKAVAAGMADEVSTFDDLLGRTAPDGAADKIALAGHAAAPEVAEIISPTFAARLAAAESNRLVQTCAALAAAPAPEGARAGDADTSEIVSSVSRGAPRPAPRPRASADDPAAGVDHFRQRLAVLETHPLVRECGALAGGGGDWDSAV